MKIQVFLYWVWNNKTTMAVASSGHHVYVHQIFIVAPNQSPLNWLHPTNHETIIRFRLPYLTISNTLKHYDPFVSLELNSILNNYNLDKTNWVNIFIYLRNVFLFYPKSYQIDSYTLHLCYRETSRRVSYKLHIRKVTCKSIELISISHPINLRYAYIYTLGSCGMSHSKKIVYCIS
jgi:hypothetical protein